MSNSSSSNSAIPLVESLAEQNVFTARRRVDYGDRRALFDFFEGLALFVGE